MMLLGGDDGGGGFADYGTAFGPMGDDEMPPPPAMQSKAPQPPPQGGPQTQPTRVPTQMGGMTPPPQMAAPAQSQVQGQGGFYTAAGAQRQSAAVVYAPEEPGYAAIMWGRRRDVLKLVMLALVVWLALSSHKIAWHYLKEYIETAAPTHLQEVAVRLAYPLAIVAVLWNLKAFL